MPTSPAFALPVLLVTARSGLREDVAGLAAAVGLPVHTVADAEAAGRCWREAGLVLLGDDAAAVGVPVRRTGVVVLAGAEASERVWRLALEAGAEAVARLPADSDWLLERLAEAGDGTAAWGVVAGVAGGRGGAGASTLAAGLAAVAAARGTETLLVDADPAGGGIDLLLGAEAAPGLRWPDLADTRGALRGSVLRDGLPRAGGLRILSCAREPATPPSAAALEAVLDAGRRGHDLVVVDLPRRDDPATVAALRRLDVLVVVVPAEVRAAAAAAGLVQRWSPHVGDARLVVRGPAPTGLACEVVADAVQLPLVGRWAHEPRLPADTDRGLPPGERPRSPLTRLCRELLTQLLDEHQARGPVPPAVAAPPAAPRRGAA